MGLFSIFKKNDARVPAPPDDEALTRASAHSEAERIAAQNAQRQRDIARATAMKIDAIEAAMELDIFADSEPPWGSRPARPRPAATAAAGATLPLLDEPTTQLLGDEELPAPAIAAESAPVVEEIAILYANGQTALAQQLLVDHLPPRQDQDRTVWWMLFDLYQITGQQDAFDNLSIDYASTFETSPPAWRPPVPAAASGPAEPAWAGVTPTAAFAGRLNEQIAPQLERLLAAADSPVLRLDFSRTTAVEPSGCALLLDALRQLQAKQRELIVVAAAELADQVRAILAVGRRDEGEASWLLLLALLQLLNREKDFEETSMDYCITFEVSPPPFEPPHKGEAARLHAAARQHLSAAPERFLLPPVVESGLDALLAAIDAYAQQHPSLVFDCSRLTRLEFGAANQLKTRLTALSADGRKIEFRDLNHLVSALLRLLGFADLARIYPHKY